MNKKIRLKIELSSNIQEMEQKIRWTRENGKLYFTSMNDITLFCKALEYGIYEFWNKGDKEATSLGFRDIPTELTYKVGDKEVLVYVEHDDGFYMVVQFPSRVDENEVLEKANYVVSRMERKYRALMFLKNYFDNLHKMEVVSIIGAQAVLYHKVYLKAIQVYPDFGAESEETRLEIMHKAQKNMHVRTKDSYAYARVVFLEINRNGLDGRIFKYEPYSKESTLYFKLSENRKNCRDIDTGHMYAENRLIYSLYECMAPDGKTKWKKSFTAQDLWKILIQDSDLVDKLI